MLSLLNEKGILHFILDNYTSIEKQRIIAGNQQLLRIDYEKISYLKDKDAEKIIEKFNSLENIKIVVFSDYKKGFCTSRLAKSILKICKEKNIKVIVDTKDSDLEKYRGAFILTPNVKELSFMVGKEVKNEEKDIVDTALKLIEKYDFEHILVTRSEKGMTLVSKDKSYKTFYVKPKEVYDVSGAGDTVVATLANF
ncbi:MAG TPA: bifunctional heptose 7-phosphate kinase/heptose 1-phosphate adenyltransferase, partial [Aquificae bacterium]|nr:bifunctional heptose 7-phosphate kinase/heptose 1-phosphate adenyltransferase [Aquificota bacterium]